MLHTAKLWTLSIASCLLCLSSDAQSAVHYDLNVTLDDDRHRLTGEVTIRYTNLTRDTLRDLVLHLYPNAYSTTRSAYAKQQLLFGRTDFHFAEEWERGGIDRLDFTVNGQPTPWSLDADHPDVARLTLTEPLLPDQSVTLRTPFTIRIPRSFSRLGRVGQSYQMTQWYPKMARYDTAGWHVQPYLDQGEFFGDFASFDVSVGVPSNYIVAATGSLESPDEIKWLDSLATARNPALAAIPPSTQQLKTLRFSASSVHDFAWFADKRFAVRKQTITLAGSAVDCYAYFTGYASDLWENSTEYIADALGFYAKHVGSYPYPHMTAVQAPLSRGGGMEYPMITLIGAQSTAFALDQVITHEVGHNWFYGMLASNERKHPWMDEGINSMYEYLYLLEKYGQRGDDLVSGIAERVNQLSDPQLLMQQMHRKGELQSPGLSSEQMTSRNYLLGAYIKPALGFWMLRAYLGEDAFDLAMRNYFEQWKFRHPGPADVRAVFEERCACDLGWLFEDLLNTPALIDYSIDVYAPESRTLTLTNTGALVAPVQVLQYRNDSVVTEQWLDGFGGSRSIELPDEEFNRVQIYAPEFTLDATPSDNVIYIDGKRISRAKTRVGLAIQRADQGLRPINVAPVIGWNDYDKTMLGVALSNLQWPPGKLLWIAAPMYATNSGQLSGLGDVQYEHFPAGNRRLRWEFGLGARTFSYLQDRHYDFFDRYYKVAPRVNLTLRDDDPFGTRIRRISYRGIYIGQHYGQGIDFENFVWERRYRSYWINELSLTMADDHVLAPRTFKATLSQGRGFVRLTAGVRQAFVFDRRGKSVYLRGFAGWLPQHDKPKANISLRYNGTAGSGFFTPDYTHDELLLGRTTRSGLVSHQIFRKDAGLKTLYTGGISESWMIGAGFATDTPLPIPVQPYVDFVVSPDLFDDGTRFNYSGGLALVLLKDVLEVYFPLFESREIRESLTYLTRKSVLQRTSFIINFAALHPFRILSE